MLNDKVYIDIVLDDEEKPKDDKGMSSENGICAHLKAATAGRRKDQLVIEKLPGTP